MTIKTDLKKHWKAGCVLAGIVFIFLAALFMLGLNKLADITPRSYSIAPAESPPEAAYTLSNEQKGLLAELGYPEAFSLHFYQDDLAEPLQAGMRLEIWTYYQAGQEVTLLNGQVIERVDIATSTVIGAPYHPEQFSETMGADLALKAAGLHEYMRAPLDTYDIPNGAILFGRQVAFGFQGDHLLYVESFALEGEQQP
jgi:hypothetical protein